MLRAIVYQTQCPIKPIQELITCHAQAMERRDRSTLGQLRINEARVLTDTQAIISGDKNARFDAVTTLVDFEFD